MRMIFPFSPYEEALAAAHLSVLSDRRQELTDKLFTSILESPDHRLRKLSPVPKPCTRTLRKKRSFMPVFKTNRFRNSFIICNALKA